MSYSLKSAKPISIYRRCLTFVGGLVLLLGVQMMLGNAALGQRAETTAKTNAKAAKGDADSQVAAPDEPAATILVTPANTQGWASSDTRPGGTVSYVYDANAPAGFGALQLTTDGTNAAKADYFHAAPAGTTLASVTQLSYYTKQVAGPAVADPAYQLPVCLTGGNGAPCNPNGAASPATSFTTLIFEPYLNPSQPITPGAWQQWDVDAGLFYSTRTITCPGGVINGGAGSDLYTLAQIKAACPAATVLGYGVNIGTFNPNYTVRTDLFDFNGTIYNFEPNATTIVVDDDGLGAVGDCNAVTPATATINAAVLAANPGDTIQVCPGVYPEQVIVNKTLTINGAQAGVDARTPSRTTNPARESIVTGVGNAGKTPFYVTANNVTINGFTVQGATDANNFGFGILLAPSTSGSQILDNIVQNNIIGLGLAGNSATNQTRIIGNLFRTNNQPGPASGFGIYTDEFLTGGTLTNVLINSNGFTSNDNGGIGLVSTTPNSQTNITISSNDFRGNGNAINVSTSTNLAITGNSILTSQFTQVFIDGSTGLIFTCNTVAYGATRGLRFADFGGGGSTNSLVNNNNFIRNPQGGIVVEAGGHTNPLNATNNYYGSPTGPTIASNPGGTGDAIIDPNGVVNYRPFLTSPSQCAPAPVTAGEVSLSGRVMSEDGRGITNARVIVSGGSLGQPVTVVTGRNGAYSVQGLTAGDSYQVSVSARRFTFDPPTRVITLNDNATDVNFVSVSTR